MDSSVLFLSMVLTQISSNDPNKARYSYFFPHWLGSSPVLSTAASCHISLISFNLEQFLSFSLSFMALTFFLNNFIEI